MRRAALLLLVGVAGCAAPRAVEVAPPAALVPPPPVRSQVAAPPPAAVPQEADFLLVDKSDRTLVLYNHGRAFRTYTRLQLGGDPVGAKRFEGDSRTPEGRYTIDYRNPRSAYHLSLHISYPSPADSEIAAAYRRRPGGEIFIHGQPNSLATGREPGDWTDGCIALSNGEIEELWRLVPDGTPIEIRP